MPSSEARVCASQINARRPIGPGTPGDRALKHGQTGAGVVLPNEDAAEVERRLAAFQEELKPSGEVGKALVRRAAVCSVRMDRSVEQETAALSERVRKAEAEFVPPEGASAGEAARLRAEAGRRAMFDPSKEATLARKYEAAAERGFFRALKELRQLEKQARTLDPAVQEEMFRQELGSFLSQEESLRAMDAELEAEFGELDPGPAVATPEIISRAIARAYASAPGGRVDVPFTIGRAR
jgi:hypothetical protein